MSQDQPVPLVLPLDDASATLERVGGKGASLACMATAGLPVPPGLHITTAAYRRFVTEQGLQEKILAAVAPIHADQPATLEAASTTIEQLFSQSALPDDIAVLISRAYTDLGGDSLPVAIRSSATAEDLPEMSFAGQQETYLNIAGETQVLEYVKRCWASLWTARAIGYRALHGIAPETVSQAVIVQKLVPADAAGILFTANPLTGSHEQVVINAAWGLGEAIVGGQVTPDTVVIEKASGKIIEQQISEKDVMTVRTTEGVRLEPVPTDLRSRPVLSPDQASELARLGIQVEDLYTRLITSHRESRAGEAAEGAVAQTPSITSLPMDIEWTLYNGHFSLLQARPITALPEPTSAAQVPAIAEWPLPRPKGHYMRASVLELLPDPLSPLFATLALPAWSEAMQIFLRDMGMNFPDIVLTTINDYGYYDITLTPAQTAKMLLHMPRILFVLYPRLMRTAQSRWQEARASYQQIVHRWEAADLTTASAGELFTGAQEITRTAANYYVAIQSGILPAAYMSEAVFNVVYNRLLKRSDDPPALTFLLGYDSIPIQAEKSLYDLAQWIREQPALATALAQMSHAEFTAAYQKEHYAGIDQEHWSDFQQRFATYLASYGAAIYDLDFAKPVPADDPGALLETLRFFINGEAPDPYARQTATMAAREQAQQQTLKQLHGVRLSLFRKLIGWAQHFAPLREDALASTGLGWPMLRRIVHEIGRRLVQAGVLEQQDDIFWLTQDDVRTATTTLDRGEPPDDYHKIVAERRATWGRERALTPPASLPLKGGARFLGIDWSAWMPARTEQPAGDVLKGIAASPGQVTATARVIAGPDEFDQMQQGDILVTRITTPAWTPLFALAAGVVTDVGGPLSHSSIVAREYHIPAVLGTGSATERLSSGQRITIDGNAGTVTISPSIY